MRPIQIITESYTIADADSVAASQTPAGAGFLTLTSSTVELTPPRFVTITSVANETTKTFTITGLGPSGNPISEDIAGGDNTTVTSTLTFASVTSIYVDAATAGAITVGFTQSGYSQWIPMDIYTPNQVTTISATVAGTINYTVQYTNEDPFDTSITQTAVSHPVAALVGASANQTGTTTTLMRAVRYLVNSGSGTLRFTIVQQSTA